jgi:acetyl esterase/lipase
MAAQPVPYPPEMEGVKVEVYKKAGDVPLRLYIFEPPGHSSSDRRAAIVFFFGGGWRAGSPQQFEHHCRRLASRGMVAIAADYRVASRHKTKAVDCVRDAKSAIRWVRRNAPRLGIDALRIAAGGGSAGGHLAAAAALAPGLDEPEEDREFSSRPDALVLFNPVLMFAPAVGMSWHRDPEEIRERAGIDPMALSPYHHISEGAPPTIIFHGKADATVPYRSVEAFAKKMQEARNRCELVGYEGRVHGFFNYGRDSNKWYLDTMRAADQFLTSLGYLKSNLPFTE